MSTHVRGQNLTYSIANHIGIAIVTGVYSADNPIPIEAELCRQYGASRPVLREAVKMLTAKGLLGARPRRGTWVQPEDKWNLLDPDVLGWLLERKFSMALLIEFTEIRLAVEPVAAALAAASAGADEKAAIRAAIVRMQAADRGEDDPLESDIAFHVAVLRGSRNRFYAQLSELIATALRFSIRMTNRYKGVRLASVADHKKVGDAIIAGKVDLAREAMRKLIQEAMDLICKREAQERRAGIRTLRADRP
ncbi:MAG TPA: FadR/GntR family transcriptional regulator [Steroidobacteraceae bacterium]|jgi:DNA-binding FadR family transcriptional regulator|nr:FadR/GntR family transcriptional regulator [Steroidobacteraceae bacterium]